MEGRPPDTGPLIERALLSIQVVETAAGRMRLVGEADLASSDALVEAFDVVAGAGATEAVLDCSALTYLDSSAIRALLYGVEVLSGEVTVDRPSTAVARILHAMALGEVLRILEA